MKTQNYADHRRYVPLYHFVLSLLLVLAFLGSLFHVYRTMALGSGRTAAVLILLLVVSAMLEYYYLRMFALKAQDRAIRVEENLRHFVLHGTPLDPKLDIRQIIGLRFASDAEFQALAKRAVDEGLSENQIKRAIKDWRGDYYRV